MSAGQPTAVESIRPLRADARRNRDAILLAAREAFESEGVLASLDAIALRAGVGNATLYRNFPTRDDLLAAVVQTSIDTAIDESHTNFGALAPRETLAGWLLQLTWQLRAWHDLPSCVVAAVNDAASPMKTACNPLLVRTRELLAAAQESGDAVAGVSGEDLFELVTALSWGIDRYGHDSETARRWVALATAGVFAA
jgi:AcrR family transcriptional regulator